MMKKSLFLTMTLLWTVSFLSAKIMIDKVEPAFWWVGMHDQELMILLHGSELAGLQASLNYDGVTIEKVVQTDNNNYLFLYLSIGAYAQAGTFEIQLKEDGKTKKSIPYTLKTRREGSSSRGSFGPEDVFYLLMPDRFSNGNEKNDSHKSMAEKVNRKDPNGRHGGDIQGIINHLDYLEDLGVTTLWTTPLLEDNMETYSYHHYATTDYFKIDPRFGNNEDYVRLSQACKQHKLKLVMDLVPNHCGLNHWWMNDLPADTWIHKFDQFTRSNYRMSTVNDPYASEQDKMLNTKGWFDTSMPDMNLTHPLVLKYFKQFAIFWVEYADLDGLRVDTYPYNDVHAASEWTQAIMDEYPNLNIVGECWQHRPSEVAYWQAGTKNYDNYNSNLKSVMDFPLTDAFMVAFNEDEQGWDGGLVKFYNNYVMDYLYHDPYNLMVFVDNHDIQRFATNIKSSIRKYKMAMTHLLTTRGIPQIYYGTELMMAGEKEKGDGFIRKDFPGGWKNDARDAFTEDGRTKLENAAFNHTRTLLHYRKNNTVLQTGAFKHFIPQDNVYVYFRYNADKTVMIVMNNNTLKRTVDTSRFSEILGSFETGRDVLTDNEIDVRKGIEINGKSAYVLELN